VPRRRDVRQRPIDYIACGDWPNATLEPSLAAAYAQELARNLHRATEGMTLRQAAQLAGLDPMTIRALINGYSWADTVSVAKLELGFHQLLWPGDGARRALLRAQTRPR
jgi:hypothetical protein